MLPVGVEPNVHDLHKLAISETISRGVKGKIHWNVTDDILRFKIPETKSTGYVTTVAALETVLREVAVHNA